MSVFYAIYSLAIHLTSLVPILKRENRIRTELPAAFKFKFQILILNLA